ncbi:hypothetical protein EV363DRAFT_1186658 [Boletus edulis]|nr:hypothetical protein EV363DRAFT_1186658 [Boletus edulis]
MAPTCRSNSSTTASSRPEPSQTTRPARANAGKGGYISQLRKTSEALDRPQREQAKDLLENEPVNHLASTLHCPRKKKTGKQRAKATALEDVNSDPLEANSSQIASSGPDGRFGLQPQAPVFVGRQALEEYEKDCVHHRTKDNTVARTGKGGVHSKQNSRNNSHDETTQMDIDDHHERRPKDEDHNSRMDVHARGGLFDFDDQQVEVPRSNGSHLRREDVIRDRNREDRMDTTGDPAPQGDARTQPPRRCPQSQPSQNTARDTAQPCRHVLNARYLQDRVLPSPPLSRSHSNEANENAHHNNDTQANVVRRGDEHIFTTWLTFEMATVRMMVHRDNSKQDMKFPSLSKSIPPMFKVAIVKMIVHRDNTSQDMKFLSLNKSMPPPPPVSKSVPLTFKKATIKTMVHRDKHPSSTVTTQVPARV